MPNNNGKYRIVCIPSRKPDGTEGFAWFVKVRRNHKFCGIIPFHTWELIDAGGNSPDDAMKLIKDYLIPLEKMQ